MIIIKHTKGDIKIQLDAEQAPETVSNFLNYVRREFYKDTIFHRVIDGFMIQGGGFTADMEQKARINHQNEAAQARPKYRGSIFDGKNDGSSFSNITIFY